LAGDFFPTVDSGQIRLHVRAPAGTRIEETERYFAKIDAVVREVIPPHELKTIIDNIGIPNSGINLALSDGSLMSSADGEFARHAPARSRADRPVHHEAAQGTKRTFSPT
jgi:multidrug efflux pump subunit AcrB